MCTKCKKNPRVNFPRSHNTWCKECRYEYHSKWKKLNKDKVNESNRKTYDPKPLVYVWFNLEGVALYVGRGNERRALWHKYTSPWWNKNLILLTMTCENEWESMEYEGKWGNKLKPKYNKDGYRK